MVKTEEKYISAFDESEASQKMEDYKTQIDNLNFVISKINKLSNFYSKIESTDSIYEIFSHFVNEIKSLFVIEYLGLFLLDDDDIEFVLKDIFPKNKKEICLKNFNNNIQSNIFGWAIKQNKFSVIPHIKSDKKNRINENFDGESLDYEKLTIIFPLKRNNKIFGALVNELRTSQSSLNNEQQAYLSIISKQLTLALGNALYLEKINTQKNTLEKYKKRNEKELNLAKKIQQNIIPKTFPNINNINFNSSYQPYEKIGGDFFDVIKISNRKFVAVIADISGHGVPAALGTATLKSALYSSITPVQFDLTKSVKTLYKHLINSFYSEQYSTLFVGEFDIITKKIRYYSFGHLPVFHLAYRKNQINFLEATTGFVGINEIKKFEFNTAYFDRGDTLLLLTDGVIETTDIDYNIFGFDKVIDILKTKKKDRVIIEILSEMKKFSNGVKIDDDVAILQIDVL